MTYQLQRVAKSPKGTFGVISKDGIPICLTCEDPDNNNKNNISCIPAGTYKVKDFSGTKYKNVWQVLDVPNRSAILIHNGNTMLNTEGCILVGDKFGTVEGLPAVLNSVSTLIDLRRIFPKQFELTIKD